MKRLFEWFSGLGWTIVGGVFLAASLVLMLTGAHLPVDPAWATVVICGYPLLYLAITRVIFQRKISSALLISIAMVASIAIGELFAAGEVAFIMAIGGILEDKTAERAKKGLKKLIGLAPTQGRRIDGGREKMVPAEAIQKGDTLRVLPGEVIPVDGDILAGDTSVDQSIMTGESLPVDKAPGDSVFCGTINRFGSIDIKASKVGEDSSLQKLIRMVEQAENNKAPMERIVDKWATWLVPIALAVAILAFVFTGDIVRGVTVLVVFCPCALALATPTSVMAAIGQATRYGVIIKSGDALERMGKVDTIAFDKTGTLTHGTLVVSDVVPLAPGVSRDELLGLAAAAEARSEHPLGKAVLQSAKKGGLDVQGADGFEMVPGKGVSAEVSGARVLCGSAAYLEENGAEPGPEALRQAENLRGEGKALILVARGGQCLGAVALSDTVRPAAKGMVQELRDMDTGVVLLTGDHEATARYFAGQVGIEDVHAGLLPAQKVEEVQRLQQQGRSICMIGDGVNDAPALKTADVGVAMGSMGSDIAVDAADIALMGDDISKIPYLKRLSVSTIKTIKFNITLSMCINFVAIILSVTGIMGPIVGALWHNAGSVLVVLNAARLYDRKFITTPPTAPQKA